MAAVHLDDIAAFNGERARQCGTERRGIGRAHESPGAQCYNKRSKACPMHVRFLSIGSSETPPEQFCSKRCRIMRCGVAGFLKRRRAAKNVNE
jgi:hypothetical protein